MQTLLWKERGLYDYINIICIGYINILDNADMLRLGGYYSDARPHYRNISDCVNCQVNQKM